MVRKQRRFKTPSPKKAGGSFPAGYLPAFVLFPLLLMAAASCLCRRMNWRGGISLFWNWEEGRCFRLWFPDFPSLKPYADLFLRSPGFFVMFWNSCLQVLCVLAGQLLVGMPAAWAFASMISGLKKRFFCCI